jgi:hypothetical protein
MRVHEHTQYAKLRKTTQLLNTLRMAYVALMPPAFTHPGAYTYPFRTRTAHRRVFTHMCKRGANTHLPGIVLHTPDAA